MHKTLIVFVSSSLNNEERLFTRQIYVLNVLVLTEGSPALGFSNVNCSTAAKTFVMGIQCSV